MNKLDIKIKVLGVGGAGCNMVSHLYSKYIKEYDKKDNIEIISINTDIQVLTQAKTEKQIVIGEKLTNGHGAGMRPEMGKESALESYQEIYELLEGTDMVFIASGMGGGTGTGAASVIAQAAKEAGALVVSIVTKPFVFEGRKRMKLAKQGIKELEEPSDSLIVIDNEKLKGLEGNLTHKNAFRMVDDVLAKAVQGIISIVLESSEDNDINVDFADLKTILSYSGSSIMSIATANGKNAPLNVIKKALDNPLLENNDISGTQGILVHFTMHEDILLDDIYAALDELYKKASEDADVIFGTTTTTEDLLKDEVRVTLIATGFKSKDRLEEENNNEQIIVKVEEKLQEEIKEEKQEEIFRLKL